MWPNPQIPAVTFTKEILNGKLPFLCSDVYGRYQYDLTLWYVKI